MPKEKDLGLNESPKTKLNLWPYLLFGAGLIIGGLGGYQTGSASDQSYGTEQRQFGYRLINPLLECEVTGALGFRELRPFEDKIDTVVNRHLENGAATKVAVYFRDLNNGRWFGLSEDEKFSPASLLKVPIMIAYYQKAESDPSLLNKMVKNDLTSDGNRMENIKPSTSIEPGKSYTIDELINRMIVFSDNNAKDLLLANRDERDLGKVEADLGLSIMENGENFMPLKAYSGLFRVLYNASYLNEEMSQKALELLTKTEFKQGLLAGVPPDVMVAHKFGERRIIHPDNSEEQQLHDCGIVYFPSRPYLLCMMTRGADLNVLAGVIRNVSQAVFAEVSSE